MKGGKNNLEERKKTVKEIKEFEEKQQKLEDMKQLFAQTKQAIQLLDLTKTESRTYTAFSKDKLRSYMKNPKTNENNLRSLSQFLYRYSHQYRRIVNYYAEMIDLSAYVVIPNLKDMTGSKDNSDNILKTVYTTTTEVRKMNMQSEIMKFLITAWREDTAYGYIYEDDTGFYIMPLDGNYCKISSVNYDGSYNFAFDFSYLRSNKYLLDFWDKEFTTKYNAYDKDGTLRWQELDPEKTFCIKINVEDTTLSTPPFLSLFEQIIDLIDLQSIQAVKEALSIYKLLVLRMDTLKNATEPDDFAVDIYTCIDYYNKLVAALPEEVSACISPVSIDPIEFKGTTTEDVDMVANSMHNLFAASGTSQILDSTKISGSTAFEASILSDTLMALKIVLPQIIVWQNRYLTYVMSNHATLKYLEVTPYTKNQWIKNYQTAATLGLPVKMAYCSLLGFDPIEASSMQFLEQDCLDLSNIWKPLQSSNTQSSDGNNSSCLGSDVDSSQGGAPTKDTTELTSEGDNTRIDDKNNA